MSALPEGTVTFLFTDIEGSTRLLHELGSARYADALAEHRRLLRAAFGAHGGVEVGTEGDAFFVAFPTAHGALEAAHDAQDALTYGPISVRMGLHTGTPYLADGDYVGPDVHKAARIAAAGHGGQVLLSKETRELANVDVTDLGEHRLKDFDAPVWIFQLGSEAFPPLKTISNTNLPRPVSSFVGREREIAEVASLLRDGARLLTLTGPGGSGKTRLAIEAAAELLGDFKAGVFWVGLAALRDPALVLETIAQTLGAKDGLADHVGERELLLLLDNLEQVVEAAPELASLVETCANLTLLTTSRERLRIKGEVEYPVLPLAEPEAIGLFCARSQLEADETIAELCRQLDSLPLAIELAAARTNVLSPAQIRERLSQRLDLLKGGRDAEARQQTLRATIAWSYDLLDDDEKRLFAGLAVFVGGWNVEAAEAVCDADLDTLASLLDKSLLIHAGEDRFSMLATIREYALDRLAAREDAEAIRRAHAEHYLAVAGIAEAAFDGPGQVDALELLEREHDNLRAALGWAVDADGPLAVRLAGTLGAFWYRHTHVLEGAAWLERAVEADDGRDPAARARVAHSLGVLNDLRRDGAAAQRWLEEAVALLRETHDASRLTRALNSLGIVSRNAGDLPRARKLLTECLAMRRELGDPGLISVTTCDLGIVAFDEGDLDTAGRLFEESLAIDRELGDATGVAINAGNLGWLALARGELDSAPGWIEQALRGFLDVGDREGLAEALEQAAALAGRRAQAREGVRLAGAAAALREAIGVPWAAKYDRERIERELDAMRTALGDEQFEQAYAEGREVDAERAAEEALAAAR